ncbi:hypothetical protein [Botrimarina mediterranea]|uniref:hypothetical protein n=1 Tax=Botrimarina mediterranea TaxID=2528022 RepID=UPI0011AB12E9|nr:hypothetical protein [Botrimarina mediterranea]
MSQQYRAKRRLDRERKAHDLQLLRAVARGGVISLLALAGFLYSDRVDENTLRRVEGRVTEIERRLKGRAKEYRVSTPGGETLSFELHRRFGGRVRSIEIGDDAKAIVGDSFWATRTVELWINGECRYDKAHFLKDEGFRLRSILVLCMTSVLLAIALEIRGRKSAQPNTPS